MFKKQKWSNCRGYLKDEGENKVIIKGKRKPEASQKKKGEEEANQLKKKK